MNLYSLEVVNKEDKSFKEIGLLDNHKRRALSYIRSYNIEGKSSVMKLEKALNAIQSMIDIEKGGKKKVKASKTFNAAKNGIKTHKNGVITYKTQYKCSCGDVGVRYIKKHESTTKCHKCNSTLVVSMIENGPDQDMNHYYGY